MKRVIIVGGGLAGIALAFRCHEEGLPISLIHKPSLSICSRVAAGLWNPIVFKRMTKSWMADELIPELHRFYRRCEAVSGREFLRTRTSIKPFTENQEKTLWTNRVKESLTSFADEVVYNGIPKGFEACKFTNGFGKINESGNLYVQDFIEAGLQYFKDHVLEDRFDYDQLELYESHIRYKGLESDALVFCEGHLVKHNPYFSWIPLKPAKGEILHINAPELHIKNGVYNRNGFILDTGESKFIVGSTYNWTDLNDQLGNEGLNELERKLRQMIDCPYTIQAHLAGVRPSSTDRRPIIGAHPKHKRLYVFNGLGTKGVMLAPYFAGKFVHFLNQKQRLPEEVNVARFYNLYAG